MKFILTTRLCRFGKNVWVWVSYETGKRTVPLNNNSTSCKLIEREIISTQRWNDSCIQCCKRWNLISVLRERGIKLRHNSKYPYMTNGKDEEPRALSSRSLSPVSLAAVFIIVTQRSSLGRSVAWRCYKRLRGRLARCRFLYIMKRIGIFLSPLSPHRLGRLAHCRVPQHEVC